MKRTLLSAAWLIIGTVTALGQTAGAARYMENLNRGVLAVRNGTSNYIGWRLLGTDPADIAFNIYRDSVKINATPIADSTNYLDSGGSLSSFYSIVPVVGGVEQTGSDPIGVWGQQFLDIPLQVPAGGTTPDGISYTYSPNDCSVGDVDGDGEYEIILKWDPSNSKDSASSGYTGNVYLDAYELNGTFLWRIDLGINIRAGAHYTQFMVYDLDSDGKAEMVCKTADGTTDGTGVVIGDPYADYRGTDGRILAGPEYLTVFNGLTGAAMATTNYIPARGNISEWGDSYGNRVDRFLACVAYLDGQQPSVVMCRGYYAKTVLAAWNWRGGQLTHLWTFDSTSGYPDYAGQGNHNLSVGDVDGDGFDEVVYGSCTIDHDGTGLYTTGLGHGDAMHLSDMDPDRPGLEVWQCHESAAAGATYRDAATGAIIWEHYNSGDVGRACAANVDSRYHGYQLWSYAATGTYTVDNLQISTNRPNLNFLVWWTGDLQRELLDAADSEGKNSILNKWTGDGVTRVLSLYSIPTSYSTCSINGTKANPCLSADILGDWREEILLRSSDNTKLRLFTTTQVISHRIYTLMHDPQYRMSVAWQNVGYNQPPHPSFYIGEWMNTPPTPNIVLAGTVPGDTTPPAAPTGLTAAACAQVTLDWADNTETDLGSYRVYRAAASGGPYTQLASSTASAYSDPTAALNTTCYYVVTAVDLSGNESAAGNEASATLVPELVAWYEMEAAVSDSSGNGNDAAASGSPLYSAGRISQAIDLDGLDDFVTLPAGVLSRDITVAAWVNWDGGGSWQHIFDFGNSTTQYMFLTPSSGSGTLRFAITTTSSTGEQVLETSPLPTAQWVHVAVTLGGDTGTLYVNGSASVSGTITINPTDFNPVYNYLGKSQWPDPLLDGRIDDVRVYNYALTAAEVANLAAMGGGDTTPPAAPAGLAATAGDSTVGLDWADNSEADLANYNVYRSATSGSGYAAIATGLATSAYTDSTAVNGTTYYYVVTAVDTSSNESAASSEVSAAPQAPSTPEMYVQNIAMSSKIAGKNYFGEATVWIKDTAGANISGATVYGTWSGAISQSVSGVTGTDGKILLSSSAVKGGGTFTFTVTDVVKSGSVYNAALNVETSDTITAP